MAHPFVGEGGGSASRCEKSRVPETPTSDATALKSLADKHRRRSTIASLILSVAWVSSSYWTFNGLMMTAEETASADFIGAVQAVIAGLVSAVVVAGCCSMLLTFSGEGEGDA